MPSDLLESLRQASERNLLLTLRQEEEHAELLRHQVWARWFLLWPLLMLLSDIEAPIRSVLFYSSSWAYRVSNVGLLPWMLPTWLALAAMMLLPYLFCLAFMPEAYWRRAAIGLAATGLGMSAFAFGCMAYIVSRFDAPAAVGQWITTAVWCVIGMLMLTAAVNREQNIARACGGPVCDV